MIFKRGRYSGFLRPISYLIDLLIIGFFANNIILEKSDLLNFTLFISFSWIISTLFSSFYEIFRYTSLTRIFSLIGKQSIIFTLLVFAFFGFFNNLDSEPLRIIKYVLIVILLITSGVLILLGIIIVGDYYVALQENRPVDESIITLMKMSVTGLIGVIGGYIGGSKT